MAIIQPMIVVRVTRSNTAIIGPMIAMIVGGPMIAMIVVGPKITMIVGGPMIAMIVVGPMIAMIVGGPMIAMIVGGPMIAMIVGGPIAVTWNMAIIRQAFAGFLRFMKVRHRGLNGRTVEKGLTTFYLAKIS
jgi:hypothetical protein